MEAEDFPIYRDNVRPAWIDYNGHMNDGYYVVAFSLSLGALQDFIGMDAAYRAKTGGTLYTAELHTVYLRELKEGTPIHITTQLVSLDAKRLHLFQRMFNTAEAYLAATLEIMLLHYDQNAGRVAAMPAALLAPLQIVAARHASQPLPPQAGRSVGMKRP